MKLSFNIYNKDKEYILLHIKSHIMMLTRLLLIVNFMNNGAPHEIWSLVLMLLTAKTVLRVVTFRFTVPVLSKFF